MKIINSFKKTACVLAFCSFLVTPQSTVCLDIGNIGLGENAKLGLICVGGGALASLLGSVMYKLWKKNSPPSDEEEIESARQLFEDSTALLANTLDTYKDILFQPIEMLETFVKAQESNTSYPFHKFESNIRDAINLVTSKMEMLKGTNRRLIERKNSLVSLSHNLRQQYGQLINTIPSLIGELQKLCDNLSHLAKNIVSFPEYKLETAQQERNREVTKRRKAEQKLKRERAKRKKKQKTKQPKKKQKTKPAPATKDFNPGLTDFWEDPFNY